MQVLPDTVLIDVVDPIISEAITLFDIIVGLTGIRQMIVQELSNLFRIALPDNLTLDLARIDFDTAGNMTVSVKARQLDWNPL